MNPPSLSSNNLITMGKQIHSVLRSTLLHMLTQMTATPLNLLPELEFSWMFSWWWGLKYYERILLIRSRLGVTIWGSSLKHYILNNVKWQQHIFLMFEEKPPKYEVQLRKKILSGIQIGRGGLSLGAGNTNLSSLCAEPNTINSSSVTRAHKNCSNINPRVSIVDLYWCVLQIMECVPWQ